MDNDDHNPIEVDPVTLERAKRFADIAAEFYGPKTPSVEALVMLSTLFEGARRARRARSTLNPASGVGAFTHGLTAVYRRATNTLFSDLRGVCGLVVAPPIEDHPMTVETRLAVQALLYVFGGDVESVVFKLLDLIESEDEDAIDPDHAEGLRQWLDARRRGEV